MTERNPLWKMTQPELDGVRAELERELDRPLPPARRRLLEYRLKAVLSESEGRVHGSGS